LATGLLTAEKDALKGSSVLLYHILTDFSPRMVSAVDKTTIPEDSTRAAAMGWPERVHAMEGSVQVAPSRLPHML
jgi:hypothetical protein